MGKTTTSTGIGFTSIICNIFKTLQPVYGKEKDKSNIKQFFKSDLIHFFLIYSLGSIKNLHTLSYIEFTFNKIFKVDLVNLFVERVFGLLIQSNYLFSIFSWLSLRRVYVSRNISTLQGCLIFLAYKYTLFWSFVFWWCQL